MIKNKQDWFLRFVKGMFIGSGFILPGVSGGALAAIFGIYERIISFLANLTKDFKDNVFFFLPIGLGAITGVFILSFFVSFLLGAYEKMMMWFFIGCIVGTVPALWQEAGKKGRSRQEWFILFASLIGGFLFLYSGAQFFPEVSQNFWTWMLAGALIALGMIVPGLSPSNFLIYMGMYKAMSDGIKEINFSVLFPLALGGILTVIVFSKLIDYAFKKAYPQLFHFILGIVFASTLMIVPTDYSSFTFFHSLASFFLLLGGTGLGAWMSRLEEKYT
ncbi:MAG: DUF368 domain-containing protein [Enterococcus sp.]|nr:DUF368 domain-containing protein [Enterococcus sp.]